MTDNQRETQLWSEYHRDRSKTNRNRLVEFYLPLLNTPVKKLYMYNRGAGEASDLYQSGAIGLIEAVESYSPEKNASFKTFSRYRIGGSIVDHLRKSGLLSLPYGMRRRRRENERLGLPDDGGIKLTSLDALAGERGGAEIIGRLKTDPSEEPELAVENKVMFEEAAAALKSLPFDQYVTIVLYYFNNRTLGEIARVLKLTRAGVWQVRNRGLENLKRALEKRR